MKKTNDKMKQLDLGVLPKRSVQRPVLLSKSKIQSIKSVRNSYRRSIKYSDLDGEDVVAEYLSIGASHFSAILNGKGKNFDDDKIEQFLEVCGNMGLVQYLANKYGYELVSIESELERDIRLLRDDNDRKDHELKTIKTFLNLKVVASNE